MTEQQTKICKKCGVEKGVGEYYKYNQMGKQGIKHTCKKCEIAINHKNATIKYKNDPTYREKVLKKTLEYYKKRGVNELSDIYIKGLLTRYSDGANRDDITPSMIERYRAKLIAKREAKANKSQQ